MTRKQAARKGGRDKDEGIDASPKDAPAPPVEERPPPSSLSSSPPLPSPSPPSPFARPRFSPKKGRRPRSGSDTSTFFRQMSSATIGATSEDIDGTRASARARGIRSWYGVATVCVVLSVLSLVLYILIGLGVDWVPHGWSRWLSIIAVSSATIAVPLTHGLAGVRKHGAGEYHFFQPFVGGYRYVLLQCVGWAVYTLVLLGAIYILVLGTRRVALSVFASVGIGGVLAQALVLASLHFYASASTGAMERQESRRRLELHKRVGQGQMTEEESKQVPTNEEPKVIAALSTIRGRVGIILTVLGIFLAAIVESKNKTLSPASHISLQSLVTSALLFGVPLTHILTGRAAHSQYSLFQPFRGGWAFVLLQALGWTLWTLAVASSVASLFLVSRNEYIKGIISGAGVAGVIAQGMMLLSLKYFDSRLALGMKRAGKTMKVSRKLASQRNVLEGLKEEPQGQEGSEETKDESAAPRIVRLASLKRQKAPEVSMSKRDLFAAMYEGRDRAALDQLRDKLAKSGRFTASTTRLNTYAEQELEDRGEDVDGEEAAGHRIFDPSSLASLSLNQWRDGLAQWVDQLRSWQLSELLLDLRCNVIIGAMYFVPTVGAFCAFSPFFIVYHFHHVWWVPPLVAACVAWYVSTLRGRPGFTGKKSWEWFRKQTLLWSCFERYFQLNIITESAIDEQEGPVIMGFHPHGIYPLTTFWGTRGPSFRAAFPKLEVDVCGASVMFNCPVLREILLWSGGREVSAASIRHCLHQRRSILLVPGGQREMLHSRADRQSLTYVTKHKGFVRMAIENGVRLVPILSLGETFCLENVYLPNVQSWFLRNTGVGFPVFPYGRWYSPIANPCPITLVVGQPIEVEQNANPTEEEVDALHKLYYDYVKELFETYKVEAGFPDQQLVFSDH